jgi:hypothetical protein
MNAFWFGFIGPTKFYIEVILKKVKEFLSKLVVFWVSKKAVSETSGQPNIARI